MEKIHFTEMISAGYWNASKKPLHWVSFLVPVLLRSTLWCSLYQLSHCFCFSLFFPPHTQMKACRRLKKKKTKKQYKEDTAEPSDSKAVY